MVGALRSFRTQRMADLIGFDAERAYIGARIQRGGLERVYELIQKPRGRQVRLDGKTLRPISKYFGDFNVVLFAPEDLQVPRGSPSARRRFLDRAVFNRDPGYLPKVQAYEKVMKNRNALLRGVSSGKQTLRQIGDVLAVFDDKLAAVGAEIVHSRCRYLDAIRPRFQAAFESITQTGFDVDAVYETSLAAAIADAPEVAPEVAPEAATKAATIDTTTKATTQATAAERQTRGDDLLAAPSVGEERIVTKLREAMAAALSAGRARDLARGVTSVGPHRDDIGFRLNEHEAAAFASQGQLRAMVLAWKTAEMEMLAEQHHEEPVLLLDDVSSELDPTRNEYLFEFLKRRPAQCFITTTHPRYVLLSQERLDYAVSGGVVTPQNPLK